MPQGFLQVLWRIEVVLEKKLHGPLASFTTLSHIGNNGRKRAAVKGNNAVKKRRPFLAWRAVVVASGN
jgi:hypothetical protein